jgi:hypothetical protein
MRQDGWLAFKGAVIGHAALGAVLVASALGLRIAETSRSRYFFSIELSPDGTRLLRSVDELLRVEDLGSGRWIYEDRGLCAPATFSDDGRSLAYLRSRGGLRLVDLESGVVRSGEGADLVALGPGGAPVVLADRGFSDGWPEKHAISLSHDGSPGERFLPFEGPLPEHFHIEEIAFSPDGALLAVGGSEANQGRSRVVVWDLREEHRLWERHADHSLAGLAFAPDGSTLAIAGGAFERGEASFVDPWSGRERNAWRRGSFLRGPIEFSPDGRLLAFGGCDVGLIDAETGTLRWSVAAAAGQVRSIRFVGSAVRTADEPGTVRDLSIATGAPTAVVRRPEETPVDPRWGVVAAGGVAWLVLWVPLGRKASQLRREKAPCAPRFASMILAGLTAYAATGFLAPFGFVPGGLEDWLVLIRLQFAGLVPFLLAGLGFFVLRVPFRKRAFLAGFPLAVFGLGVQVWLLAAITASC